MDPNWIIAIIAFVAIISPVLTSIIDNIVKYKIKKLDMYEDAKRNALCNFINSAQSAILNSEDSEIVLNYICSYDQLFIYFSELTIDDIKPLDLSRTEANNNYSDEKFRKANTELTKLVEKLSKQIAKK